MTFSAIKEIIPYIRSGDRIPHRVMLAALNESSDSMFGGDLRVVAREFSHEAGDYLPGSYLLDFISAKLDEKGCRDIIDKRMLIIARMEELLPSVLRFFGEIDVRALRSVIEQVYDCCVDYQTIVRAAYSSKQRKKILEDIHSLIDHLTDIDKLLKRSGWHIAAEYEDHRKALARIHTVDQYQLAPFEELQEELGSLRLAAEVALFQDAVGADPFYVGDNKARTHIVESAYNLSLRFDAPSFVTTPGSDFSYLCSLLFELATGTQDESLAGAINRFARSELKAQIDREEEELRRQESEEGIQQREADNFAGIKQRIASLTSSEAFWRQMMSSRQWDAFSETQIALRLSDIRKQREIAENTQGPHLVWANQLSTETHEEYRREAEEHEMTILRLAIELGLRVRARPSQHALAENQESGSTPP